MQQIKQLFKSFFFVYFSITNENAFNTKLFRTIVFSVFILIISCTNKQEIQVKNNLIPEEKLIPLIVDVHLFDAYMNLGMNDSISFDPKKINNAIFEKHGTTREKFTETINYYSQDPQQLDSLYEKILVRMSEMKAEIIDPKKNQNKINNDSVVKSNVPNTK